MKPEVFFMLLAAIYLAPTMSRKGAVITAFLCTIVSVSFIIWR